MNNNPYPIRSIGAVAVLEIKYCHGQGTPEDPCREVTEYWLQTPRVIGSVPDCARMIARFDSHADEGSNAAP